MAALPSWTASLEAHIHERLSNTFGGDYRFDLKVYGANGTIHEPADRVPLEAVIVFDLIGESQEVASGMARAKSASSRITAADL